MSLAREVWGFVSLPFWSKLKIERSDVAKNFQPNPNIENEKKEHENQILCCVLLQFYDLDRLNCHFRIVIISSNNFQLSIRLQTFSIIFFIPTIANRYIA